MRNSHTNTQQHTLLLHNKIVTIAYAMGFWGGGGGGGGGGFTSDDEIIMGSTLKLKGMLTHRLKAMKVKFCLIQL